MRGKKICANQVDVSCDEGLATPQAKYEELISRDCLSYFTVIQR